MKSVLLVAATAVVAMLVPSASAFSYSKMTNKAKAASRADKSDDISRRSLLMNGGIAAAMLLSSGRAAKAEEVKWDVFNGLIYNYRGNGFAGLDASTLDEPSIPFLEFGEKLKKDEVEFVEFLAPDGDAAYVTFKPTAGEKAAKPIRIGEGFPIEQHDGYSSPAFVVRALQNYNVPYKFTVPGLAAYK